MPVYPIATDMREVFASRSRRSLRLPSTWFKLSALHVERSAMYLTMRPAMSIPSSLAGWWFQPL